MVLVLATAALTPANAQSKGEWSVKGGVGFLSFPDLICGLVVGLGSIDATEGVVGESFTPMINPNLEFYYGVNNWLALGGSVSVGYASAKTVFSETGVVNKSISCLYPSMYVSALTRYFTVGRFSMYGSWGVGAMGFFVDQWTADGSNNLNSDAITIMGNAYPLCFSYGGRTGGFAELGWGAKGFVNVGIYHAF